MTITGVGFSTTPANNTIVFSSGAVGTVTAATSTSLTVSLTTRANVLGSITAAVTTNTMASGNAVQVATIIPVVTNNTAALAINATTMVINGFGFSTTAANNTVTFNNGAVGTVTTATATALTVTFSTRPTAVGNLTASVSVSSISSGTAVQVATVSPVMTASAANLPASSSTIVINGQGFSTTPATTSSHSITVPLELSPPQQRRP